MKPTPPSDRCGVSSAENNVGSVASAGLLSLMRLHYTGFMARKTTPRKATPKTVRETAAAKKRKPGKPKPWRPEEVEEAFRRFSKASPGPQTELQYVNPYTLLVAVVLSAQATD